MLRRGTKAAPVQLANELAEAGEVERVKTLLEPLLPERCGEEQKRTTRPFLFNIVLKAYANAADLVGAEAWYRRMLLANVHPNWKTFGKLCKSAAKAREPLSAERWLWRGTQAPLHFPVTPVQLTSLVDACKDDPQRAECWLRRRELLEDVSGDRSVTSVHAAGASVAAWAKAGDLRNAEMAFNRAVRDNGVSKQLWTTLLDAYSKNSASDKAAEWFHAGVDMKLRPCAISYTSVMEAFARTRDTRSTEEWMLSMVRAGVPVEGPTCAVLLGSLAKVAEVERIEAWMRRMKEAMVGLDTVAYTTLITACSAAGDAERAEAVHGELPTLGLQTNVVSHTALVQAHLKSRHPERLARASHAMERMLASAEVCPNALSFGLLIGGFASEGHVAQAEDWYARMRVNLRAADLVAHNAVINAATRAGDALRARLWWERLEAAELRADAMSMNTVLEAVVRSAPEEADSFFRQLGRARVTAAWPTEVTFAILMRPFAERGDLESVDRLWQQMSDWSVQPQACNLWAVLSACANSKPMLPDTAAQRYQDWVRQGGRTDRHVISALRAALEWKNKVEVGWQRRC